MSSESKASEIPAPLKNGFNKTRFTEGEDVLATRNKKEYCLGTIRVARTFDYLIKFDDTTESWYNEHWLQKLSSTQSYTRIQLCKECRREDDPEKFCDECHRQYHRKCLHDKDENLVKRFWDCDSCVVQNRSTSDETRSETKEILTDKSQLPYNIDELEWDEKHQWNKQGRYCYCGKDGEFLIKMLQCLGCKQWFHQRCLRSYKVSMLFGDFFYVFSCTICQKGDEYLRRLVLSWPELIKLILFHLQEYYCSNYHDLDTVFLPFCENNWNRLVLPDTMQKCKEAGTLKFTIQQIINSEGNDLVVKYSNPENKEKFQFGLKSNFPPLPSSINKIALKDFHLTDAHLELAGINFIRNPMEIVKIQPSEPKIKILEKSTVDQEKEREKEKEREMEKLRLNVMFCPSNLKQNENQNLRKKNSLLRKRSNTLADIPVKKTKLSNNNSSNNNGSSQNQSKVIRKSEFKSILEEFVPKLVNFDGKNHPFHLDNLTLTTAETTILRKIRTYHINKKEIKRTRKRKEGKFGKNHRKRIFNLQNHEAKLPSSSSSSVSEESSVKSHLSVEQKQEVLKQRLTNHNNNSISKSTDSYNLLSDILKNGESKCCDVKKNVEIALKSPSKHPSINAYFLKMIDEGDKIADFDILSERLLDDGSKQYLVNWDNSCPRFLLDSL